MIKEGVLKSPDVDAIFGLHINSGTPVNTIRYKPGGTMALFIFRQKLLMGFKVLFRVKRD